MPHPRDCRVDSSGSCCTGEATPTAGAKGSGHIRPRRIAGADSGRSGWTGAARGEFALGRGARLSLLGQRRNAAGRWVDDQRSAPTHMLERDERIAVRSGDVALTPPLIPTVTIRLPLAVEGRGAALVEIGVLLIRQELAVRVAFRPLERNVELFGPNPLEIGLAPGCARRRPGLGTRGRLSRPSSSGPTGRRAPRTRCESAAALSAGRAGRREAPRRIPSCRVRALLRSRHPRRTGSARWGSSPAS